MSAYSWGVEISRRSNAIQEADAMTLRSNEIRWWNTLERSLLLLIASAMAFSSAITDIAFNWQKNVIQHHGIITLL